MPRGNQLTRQWRPLHRSAASLIGTALLVTGCATAPAGPIAQAGQPGPEQRAVDRAACEASARQAEESRVLRAALGTGLLAGGLVMLYGAAHGAGFGFWSGAGAADGARIGAAVGAGVGLIIGTVAGVARARQAQSRYESAYERCMSDRADLDRLARWYAFDKPELRPVLPEALDTVERVMAAGFWQRALASEDRHVEVPFAARIDAAGGGPATVLHGVIDLAFRTPEGWELIDYKTDQDSLAALIARYRDQIKVYSKHWAALAAGPVACASLYSIRALQLSENIAPASIPREA